MKTKSSSTDHPTIPPIPEDQSPDPDLLSTLAEELETDENVEKLAEKLSKEWTKSGKDAQEPNLAFSKFLDKLNKEKNQ